MLPRLMIYMSSNINIKSIWQYLECWGENISKCQGGIGQYYKYTTVLKMYINRSWSPLDIYTNASYGLRKTSVQLFYSSQLRIWKGFWLLKYYYQTYILKMNVNLDKFVTLFSQLSIWSDIHILCGFWLENESLFYNPTLRD